MPSILPCGRVVAEVRVFMPGWSRSGSAMLLVDTGAEASALPHAKMPPAAQGAKASHPITFHIGGVRIHTMLLTGPMAETDVEIRGGGRQTSRVQASPNIRVHLLQPGALPFRGFEGLLGMDMLDSFGIDPVKDAAATFAYMAKRA
jgi:hypothetical protein